MAKRICFGLLYIFRIWNELNLMKTNAANEDTIDILQFCHHFDHFDKKRNTINNDFFMNTVR